MLLSWIPCLQRNLEAHRRGAFEPGSHERNNIYDRYAIAANKRLRGRLADSIIGHLPREISRATRFFLLRGGMVHLKVTDENYRQSPLIQGGLEIPVEVICEMDDTPRNRAIMERYKTLVTTQYNLQRLPKIIDTNFSKITVPFDSVPEFPEIFLIGR